MWYENCCDYWNNLFVPGMVLKLNRVCHRRFELIYMFTLPFYRRLFLWFLGYWTNLTVIMTTNQLRESLLFKDNTTTTTITLLQTINGRAIHCGNYKLLFISMYYHSIAVLLQTILLLFLLTQAKLLGREMYAIDKKTWSLLCRVASSLMHEILRQSGLNRHL